MPAYPWFVAIAMRPSTHLSRFFVRLELELELGPATPRFFPLESIARLPSLESGYYHSRLFDIHTRYDSWYIKASRNRGIVRLGTQIANGHRLGHPGIWQAIEQFVPFNTPFVGAMVISLFS
jgi:hypothetical protein